MPAVLMTGYDKGKVQLSDQELSHTVLLAKPVNVAKLSQTLNSLS